jgi:hypothetical protein
MLSVTVRRSTFTIRSTIGIPPGRLVGSYGAASRVTSTKADLRGVEPVRELETALLRVDLVDVVEVSVGP